ncbi:MAG: FkbM family methyltransferase [Candidatus Paceibacterota bacterium]
MKYSVLFKIKTAFILKLQYLAYRFGYKIIKLNTPINPRFQNLLPFLFLSDPDHFFFVHIGANDGRTNDPLFHFVNQYRPRGIFVEPQNSVFDSLKKTYEGYEGLQFANIALGAVDGKCPLYIVKKNFQASLNKHRRWGGDSTALASFSKGQLKKSMIKIMPNFFSQHPVDDYISQVEVTALTFGSFVKKYAVKRIDVLQIDTEGFDYEVIKMFDFDTFLPSVINYESKHLSLDDKTDCKNILRQRGYFLLESEDDTCAIKL